MAPTRLLHNPTTMVATIIVKLFSLAWNVLQGLPQPPPPPPSPEEEIASFKDKLDTLQKTLSTLILDKVSGDETSKISSENIEASPTNPKILVPDPETTASSNNEEEVPPNLSESEMAAEKEKVAKREKEDKEKFGETDLEIIPFPFVSFGTEDLSGLEEQVTYLRENVLFPLANQEFFDKLGKDGNVSIKTPRSILFHGPNYGMRTLAMALASEIGKILQNRDKPVNQMRMFQRPLDKVFRKYSTEGGTFVTQIFNQATRNKSTNDEKTENTDDTMTPFIILIEEINTLCLYERIGSSEYCDTDSTKNVVTEVEKLSRGVGFLIATTPSLDTVPTKHKMLFDLFVEFPKEFDPSTKIMALKRATALWKFQPSPALLEEMVQLSSKFNGEELQTLAKTAYFTALQRMVRDKAQGGSANSCKNCCNTVNNLKVDQSMLDSVNPTISDWKAAVTSVSAKISIKATPVCPLEKYYSELKSASNSVSPLLTDVDASLSFSSVGGLHTQIQGLKDNIIFPLEHKASLAEWGIQPVRGIIFHGPPGTGKTLLGKALAAELSRLELDLQNEDKDSKNEKKKTKFSFFYQKSSDCFNKYVGETERNLRELFATATKNGPSILFFDEIDGLCPTRGGGGEGGGAGDQWRNSVVTTLLGLMDGVERGRVFVIAATNRLDSIDPAMRRPGRFDQEVAFHLPKEDGRSGILEIHTKAWKQGNSSEVLAQIAKQTEGYSGADLEQLCRQAFVLAVRRHFSQTKARSEAVPASVGASNGEKSATFAGFTVLPCDWREATTTVKASPSGAFGSGATVAKPLPAGICKLFEQSINAILVKMSPFLDQNKPVVPSTSENCGAEKGSGLKSFYIWGAGVKKTKAIHYFLIPALLSRPELKECVAFTLDFSGPSLSSIQARMSSIFSQATSPGPEKTGLLLIPGIDSIRNKLDKQFGSATQITDFLAEQFHSLRGENVIILGTGGLPPPENCEEFASIFRGVDESRCHEVSLPTAADYRELFSTLLENNFPNQLDRLEQISSQHELELMEVLNLKGEIEMALQTSVVQNDNSAVTAKNLEGILTFFERQIQTQNRFSGSSPCLGMYT